MEWALYAEKELQEEANKSLGILQYIDMFKALEESLREMKELEKVNLKAEETPFIEVEEQEEVEGESDKCEESKVKRQKNMKKMLAEATRVHLVLVKSFYNVHLAQKSILRFESCTYDTSSSKS